MPSYTITAVKGQSGWTGSHGPMVTYDLELGDAGAAQLNQKPATPPPTVGQSIEGDLVPSGGDFPPKLKKAQKGGFGGGGGGGMSPEREASIIQQHSQEMALRYAVLRQAQGKLPDDFSMDDLFLIADKFTANAKGE